jgi:hypothetical protein
MHFYDTVLSNDSQEGIYNSYKILTNECRNHNLYKAIFNNW